MNVIEIVSLLNLLLFEGVVAWPEGTYGLPMPQSGCPNAEFTWQEGSRTQKTEQGSYGSYKIHLAGIREIQSDIIMQNFCIKTSFPPYGDYSWSEGQYCIFKKDSCPPLFEEGSIYWDDAAPFFGGTVQTFSGVLPEGTYDRNTKIFYCCRNDGPTNKPLHLPNSSPFYLFKMGLSCQEVAGMRVSEEFVYWSDESTLNFDAMWGTYPRLTRSKYPIKYTTLYYCYYEPQPSVIASSSTALYVLLGLGALIFGSVLLAAILCLVNRLMWLYRKHYVVRTPSAQTTDTSDDCQPSLSPISFPSPPPKYSAIERQSRRVTRDAHDSSSQPLTSGDKEAVENEMNDRHPIMSQLIQPPSYEEVMRSESVSDESERRDSVI